MVTTNAVPMPVTSDESGDMLFDANAFKHAMELAKIISQSALIPPHLRGRIPDILLALYMARTMGENPLLVLQSIHVISGRAGWSAQYLIARANGSGRFRGPIRWRQEGEGPTLAVTAYATLAETGDDVEYTVSMATARAEGWANRNPKYQTMPELMLRYRSATLLVRLFCPDVLMGLYEREELVDSGHGAGTQNREPASGTQGRSFNNRSQMRNFSVPPLPPEIEAELAEQAAAKAGEAAPAQDRQDRQEAMGEQGTEAVSEASPSVEVKAPKGRGARSRKAEARPVEALAAEAPVGAEARAAEPQPAHPAANEPHPAETSEPVEDRRAVLARLAKLREEHPYIVRTEARRLGLHSPARSDVVRLMELVTVVEGRLRDADLSGVKDSEELMVVLADVQIAVEEGVGNEAVLEAARAAGLPVGSDGPVLEGATDPDLMVYLDELRKRRRLWPHPAKAAKVAPAA